MPRLAYCLERPSALDDYVLDCVCSTLGLQPEPLGRAEAATRPHLYYGDQPLPTSRIVVPSRPGDVVWDDLLRGRLHARTLNGRLPFDAVHAIGVFLTDAVNADRPPRAFDASGSLRYAASFQAQHGLGDVPPVNVYVSALAEVVERQLGITARPLWPPGKRAAIALSHDVDRPYKYAILRALREGRLPRTNNLPYFAAKAIVTLARRLRDRNPNNFWLFDPLIRSEMQRGLRSTFFFSVMPSYGRYGWKEDVYYDIDWAEFTPVFDALRQHGFEIGLHASYNAHLGLDRIAREKQHLEARCGGVIHGVRHHYWHLGPKPGRTLRFHAQAGFRYDSSLAFDDHVGFRRNVALPYYPWDADQRAPLRTLQIPTMCMDGNLFYRRGRTVESAVEVIRGLVETLKRVGGVGAINWHVRMSYPGNPEYAAWGRAYQAVLDLVAADSELWVTGLGEIAAWFTQGRLEAAAAGAAV